MKFQKKAVQVLAWRFERNADVPIWVFKSCHDLGDGKKAMRVGDELHNAEVGDWIVKEDDIVFPLPDAVFREHYEPIPE